MPDGPAEAKWQCLPETGLIFSARPDRHLSGTYSGRLWDTRDTHRSLFAMFRPQLCLCATTKSRRSTVPRVVAVLLLFRHEGKFGVAFDDGGVEGGELVASLILAGVDQQFVGQVGTATQGTDGLSNSIFVFKPRYRTRTFVSSPIIAAISGIFLRHRTGRRPESADQTPVCADV